MPGGLYGIRNDKKVKLKAGQYHLTDVPLFRSLFTQASSSNIFITYFSKKLLKQLGLEIFPCNPLKMPDKMNYLIKIIHNPYVKDLRDFYYENSVRELIFFHLTQTRQLIPGELNDRVIAAIHKADEILLIKDRGTFKTSRCNYLSFQVFSTSAGKCFADIFKKSK